MTISRRDFLSGSAAIATLPVFTIRGAAATLPRDADIVVIGGGAAGIAAARRVAAANRRVLLIEATDRLGGRCVTDTTAFEVPFDRGARWLYNPDGNPVAKLARGAGIDLLPAQRGQKIRIGRRNARAGESEDFLATLVRAIRGIDEAARRGDIACAAALPKDLREWAGATDFLLGPYASGKDLSALSAVDQSMAQRREALSSCRQGVGSLVAKLGEVLPVALSTPVTRIVWSGRDVQVETPSGTIAARGAIVTASTNVLAAGRIKFSPELPKRQSDAFARLSLGSYDHIALELPGNPLGLARDDVVIEQSADNRTAFLLANLGGSSLCQVDVAGAFGADISARGEAAMTAFAVEWLTKLFGGDVAAAVKWKTATRWNDMPYVLGAMSAAAPGGQSSRKALMETVGSIFFAGEATHETQWGTVGGAWESGERAADAALRKISGGKDAPVVERPTVKTKKSAKRSTTTSAVPPAERGLFWPRN